MNGKPQNHQINSAIPLFEGIIIGRCSMVCIFHLLHHLGLYHSLLEVSKPNSRVLAHVIKNSSKLRFHIFQLTSQEDQTCRWPPTSLSPGIFGELPGLPRQYFPQQERPSHNAGQHPEHIEKVSIVILNNINNLDPKNYADLHNSAGHMTFSCFGFLGVQEPWRSHLVSKRGERPLWVRCQRREHQTGHQRQRTKCAPLCR